MTCGAQDTAENHKQGAQDTHLIGLSHLPNSSGLNKIWQHKGGLLNTTLALEVLPLLTPMPGHRYTVTVGLRQSHAGVSMHWHVCVMQH